MDNQIILEQFKKDVVRCLKETFENVHGIYLDKNTSLFETLENISAKKASNSIGENRATIAAHVEHIRFYLDVLNDVMQKEELVQVDWKAIWQNDGMVTNEEWEDKKQRLKESYEQVLNTIKNYDRWEGEYGIAGSLAVLAHTAYHLGSIRQALGSLTLCI